MKQWSELWTNCGRSCYFAIAISNPHFRLETFPALKKRSENKVAQNLCHPLHVIYDLINRRELKAFSLLVLRVFRIPRKRKVNKLSV